MVPLLPVEGFAPWAEYLAACGDVRVSGLRLIENYDRANSSVYLCIEVACIDTGDVDLVFTSAHISIGTYKVEADPARKRISTQAKTEALCTRLISEARARTAAFERGGAHMRVRPWTAGQGRPAIFTLLLCDKPFAVQRLVEGIQTSMQGVFRAMHGMGPRTMLHLRGPDFHLSIYSDVQVVRR